MMLPISENGIFWNVYEQECRFKRMEVKPPRFVRATCDKLAALYPDLDDAEMFMRSQFVLGTNEIRYSLPKLVFGFKDFIKDRHHQLYREYKSWHFENVESEIQAAVRKIRDMQSAFESNKETFERLLEEAGVTLSDWNLRGTETLMHLPEEQQLEIYDFVPESPNDSTSPLVRYLLEKGDCPQEYQDHIVIDCLHFPHFMDVLALTDDLEKRIQSYKDEVRGIVRRTRSSGNSKYQPIDLSDI